MIAWMSAFFFVSESSATWIGLSVSSDEETISDQWSKPGMGFAVWYVYRSIHNVCNERVNHGPYSKQAIKSVMPSQYSLILQNCTVKGLFPEKFPFITAKNSAYTYIDLSFCF